MAALKVLLVLLCLGVTTSSEVDLQKRLIGGRPCKPDERQYHVLVLKIDKNLDTYFCGGSLLRNGWILTAAHCWKSGRTIDAYLGLHLGNRVPLRILDSSEKPEIYTKGFWFMKKKHDLMLLKVPETATIPPGVTTIELPDCSHQPNINDVMQIAGHGSTIGSSSTTKQNGFSPVLQCGNINKVECPGMFINHSYIYKYCFLGQTPGVDLCRGDSGGGVEYNGRIYGVTVIGGVEPCREPIAFMDLCHQDYLRWIERTIGPPSNP